MIPKKVLIGGHEVTVELSERKVLSGNNSAAADLWDNRIEVRDDQCESQKEQDLCHEILELLIEKTGVRYLLSGYEESGRLREQICQSLDGCLWQFLKNNTNFFDEKETGK